MTEYKFIRVIRHIWFCERCRHENDEQTDICERCRYNRSYPEYDDNDDSWDAHKFY